jgi:hypothetical protein
MSAIQACLSSTFSVQRDPIRGKFLTGLIKMIAFLRDILSVNLTSLLFTHPFPKQFAYFKRVSWSYSRPSSYLA